VSGQTRPIARFQFRCKNLKRFATKLKIACDRASEWNPLYASGSIGDRGVLPVTDAIPIVRAIAPTRMLFKHPGLFRIRLWIRLWIRSWIHSIDSFMDSCGSD
jgi:hypothetical protein